MARNTKHNIFTVRKVMILHVSVILFTGAGGMARRHPTLGRQPPSPLAGRHPNPGCQTTVLAGKHPPGRPLQRTVCILLELHSCYRTHKRSLSKVMFLQVSVCPQGEVCDIPSMHYAGHMYQPGGGPGPGFRGGV